MNIRETASADLERIVYLFGQLGYSTRRDQVGKQLGDLGESGMGRAFVAEDCGIVIGVAVVHLTRPLHVDTPWAMLSALVVDDNYRSSGVGARLLAAAEGFAMAHDCAQLELSSSSARTRAHEFYERNGYQEKRKRFVKIF